MVEHRTRGLTAATYGVVLAKIKTTTCTIDSCEKPTYQNKDMCGSHFMKWYRHGDPHYSRAYAYEDLSGRRFGSLIAVVRTEGKWDCLCDCGAETVVRVGDLNSGSVRSCGDRATHARLAAPGYSAVHMRLRVDRGSASNYKCADCDQDAKHWSYNHNDPSEFSGIVSGYSISYSADVSRYSPRCVPCHKAYDLAVTC